jgi:hypothetical protein
MQNHKLERQVKQQSRLGEGHSRDKRTALACNVEKEGGGEEENDYVV